MIAKKKTSKKRNQVLGIIVGIALVATLIMLYFIFFNEPDVSLDALGGGLTAPTATLDTKFNTEIFEDSRLKNLKQFGPAEVQVQYRGRANDPFQPF